MRSLTLMLPFLILATAHAGDRITGKLNATRSEVIARNGVAATSHPLATQIAIDILKAGGSAVDAAIAANAALGLMEPTGGGLGGDLFAIVWDPKTSQLYGLNASGRSPQALTLEQLRQLCPDGQIPPFGPLPLTVPGCVDGWFELHNRFGKLPMNQILAPTINYAREGFPVTELIAHYWHIGGQRLADYPGFRDTFLPDGRAPRTGDLFRNPALADTLEHLATDGRDAFYRGPIADRIDAFARAHGAFLRQADFAAHHSEWVDPISTNYRGYSVYELPPNGQGLAALQMLNMLEFHDLAALGHNTAAYLHLHLEIKKLAFADRARYYADPACATADLAMLASKKYAATRLQRFDPDHAAATVPPGDIDIRRADARLRHGDTVYLTVADKNRMMVSLIQSNYRGFGSGMCPTGLGFCLQDRGELFSLDPQHPNAYAPGKRPFHTIIPAFVLRDGAPWLSFGVMGGDMQPQGHAQILCNIIDFGMNLQEAGDAARYYHTGAAEPTDTLANVTAGAAAGVVVLESGIPAEVRRDLAAKGHKLVDLVGPFGGYQAIRYDAQRDVYFAASESRKDGCAAGY